MKHKFAQKLVSNRALLLAAPVLAAQLVLSQTALGPALSGISAVQAQEGSTPKKEQETRLVLNNRENMIIAQAAVQVSANTMGSGASPWSWKPVGSSSGGGGGLK